MVTGPGGIQGLSQGCKEGALSSVGQLQAPLTPHSGTPGRNLSPLFPSLGQLKGEIRAGKRALPSPALEDASTLHLTECFSGLGSPSKAPNPSATSHGHHGNRALASRLVLDEVLAPSFIFLDRGGRNYGQSLSPLPTHTERWVQQQQTQQLLPSARSRYRSSW